MAGAEGQTMSPSKRRTSGIVSGSSSAAHSGGRISHACGSPFFARPDRVGPQYGEVSMRQQRQRDVTIPGLPPADLILVQSHFSFGGLQAFFNRPTRPRYLHQLRQRGADRRKARIVGDIRGILQAPPPSSAHCHPGSLPGRSGTRTQS